MKLSRSLSVAILPGEHWYQVGVFRRSMVDMLFLHDDFYCEAIFGFRLEAAPGTAYELVDLDNGDLYPANERKVYRASLEIKERFAEQKPIVRHIPVECASWDLFDLGWFKFNRDVFAKGGLLAGAMRIVCRVEQPVSGRMVTCMVFAPSPNHRSDHDRAKTCPAGQAQNRQNNHFK
jgi:hypothetical protein